jgi:membrane protease YdiL (CAAX protease family)
MIFAALILLIFITIYKPTIEYFLPDMPANYAILLRKGLQALTIIVYITALKVWKKTTLSHHDEHSLIKKKASKKALIPLLPVIVFSFSPYLYGFKNFDIEDVLVTALICILIGIIEELSLRGVVYSALQPYGTSYAVVLSSAVFGLVHLPNMLYNNDIEGTLYQVFFAFGFGLVMAVTRYRTGLLLPQLLVHALWDFNVKVSETSLNIPLADVTNLISEILVVIFGIVLMLTIIKENSQEKADISTDL